MDALPKSMDRLSACWTMAWCRVDLYSIWGLARHLAHAGTLVFPQNSEKTDTFYTFMSHYAEKGYHVVTAEHPIQAFLPSVTQVEIDVSRKLLFSKVLKSFINEDADIFGITDITEEFFQNHFDCKVTQPTGKLYSQER